MYAMVPMELPGLVSSACVAPWVLPNAGRGFMYGFTIAARHRLHFGQSEIQDLCLAARREENVRGLNVAMNDAFGMSRGKRVGYLNTHIEHQAHVYGRAVAAMFQRLPFQQFHGDERLILSLADIVDGANIRMIESGCSAGLTLKAVESLAISGHFGREKFQGNVAAEAGVFGFVDHAHSASAQPFEDSIVRDSLTEHV